MQIVIDIPDDIYSTILKQYRKDKDLQTKDNLYKAIANGTPLPKGHGRLIDADASCDYFWDNRSNKLYIHKDLRIVIDNAPTVLDADKEKADQKRERQKKALEIMERAENIQSGCVMFEWNGRMYSIWLEGSEQK